MTTDHDRLDTLEDGLRTLARIGLKNRTMHTDSADIHRSRFYAQALLDGYDIDAARKMYRDGWVATGDGLHAPAAR